MCLAIFFFNFLSMLFKADANLFLVTFGLVFLPLAAAEAFLICLLIF
jgi:hypothetical protein